MTTSANVIEYSIINIKTKEEVGSFRKHMLCKFPEYSDLLIYEPLCEHEITPWGYDEEEEYWEGETQNLENYLRKDISLERKIKEYFEKFDTK
jgi:hypothetical protein